MLRRLGAIVAPRLRGVQNRQISLSKYRAVEQCDYMVAQYEDGGELMELPINKEDNSLGMSTLTSAFPGSHGLKYKNPKTGASRALMMDPTGSKFFSPIDGWNGKTFSVIFPPSRGTKEVKLPKSDNRSVSEENEGAAKQKGLDGKTSDLVCRGLNHCTTDESLRKYFEQFGKVISADLKFNHKGMPRGFGFIRMASLEEQEKVLSQYKHVIDGRRVGVKIPDAPIKKSLSAEYSQIYVRGLPETTTDKELRDLFEVEAKKLDTNATITDCFTFQPFKGFGYVTFSSSEVARKICVANNFSMCGFPLTVLPARGTPSAPRLGEMTNAGRHGSGIEKGLHDMPINIVCRGMNESTTEETFKKHFEQFGKVIYANLKMVNNEKSWGYGFVHMSSLEEQDNVLSQNYHEIDGRRVEVKIPDPKNEIFRNPVGHGNQVIVEKIQETTTKMELRALFEVEAKKLDPDATVTDCFIIYPFNGIGFVTFSSCEIARNICVANNFSMNGSLLKVSPARGRPSLGPSSDKEPMNSREDQQSKFAATKLKRLVDKPTYLICKGVKFSTSEETFKKHFEQFGKVRAAYLQFDNEGKSRGFGFVLMSSLEEQLKILSQLHEIEGCILVVEIRDSSTKNSRDIFLTSEQKQVWVERLTENTSDEELGAFFEAEAKKLDSNATITECFIPRPFKGFGFVTFSKSEMAREICMANNFSMNGSSLNVSLGHRKSTDSSLSRKGTMREGGSQYESDNYRDFLLAREEQINNPDVWVGGLLETTTEKELRDLFEAEAKKLNPDVTISDCFIPQPFRGFGFVSFSTCEVAREIYTANNFSMNGSPLNVCAAFSWHVERFLLDRKRDREGQMDETEPEIPSETEEKLLNLPVKSVCDGSVSEEDEGAVKQKGLDDQPTGIIFRGMKSDTTEETMRKYFEQFGTVNSALKLNERLKPKRIGYVLMSSQEEQEKVLNQLKHVIDGRRLKVDISDSQGETIRNLLLIREQSTKQVYVEKLPKTTKIELRAFFEAEAKKFDPEVTVTDCYLVYPFKGCGYVTFSTCEVARKICSANNFSMNGSPLTVNPPVPLDESSDREKAE